MYVTINTLIFDDEFEQLKQAIVSAAQADADALIVQNHGVARLARQIAPELPLHASTQMSVHTMLKCVRCTKWDSSVWCCPVK